MELLGSTYSEITKYNKGENVPYLEITEVVLIHCNVVNTSHQKNSRVLSKFVPNKSFGQLLGMSPENLNFLKAFHSEFSYIEVLFADQSSNLLEIDDKINITLVINWSITYKKWHASQFNHEIFVKDYEFLSLTKNVGKNIGKNVSKSSNSKYSQKNSWSCQTICKRCV